MLKVSSTVLFTLALGCGDLSASTLSKQEKCNAVARVVMASDSSVSAKTQEQKLRDECYKKPNAAVDRIYKDTMQFQKETS